MWGWIGSALRALGVYVRRFDWEVCVWVVGVYIFAMRRFCAKV
jgi:hypothetical protein